MTEPSGAPSITSCAPSLDALITTFHQAPQAHYPSPEHAGLAAVLTQLTDTARRAIAHTPDRYDHRSLYEFCAALDYTLRPPTTP